MVVEGSDDAVAAIEGAFPAAVVPVISFFRFDLDMDATEEINGLAGLGIVPSGEPTIVYTDTCCRYEGSARAHHADPDVPRGVLVPGAVVTVDATLWAPMPLNPPSITVDWN